MHDVDPIGLHGPQLAPCVPHEVMDCEDVVSHVPPVPPLQQPLGQVLASHAHAPEVGSQSPFAQGKHDAPPTPHEAPDWEAKCSHVPWALQQPSGHDAALQTQEPDIPHARPVGQGVHAAPPAPQDVGFCEAYGTHDPCFVQHPAGHEAGVHVQAPDTQTCPGSHAAHDAPAVPHAVAVVDVTHSSAALQQPVVHVVGPHVGPDSLAASKLPSEEESAWPSGAASAEASGPASSMVASVPPSSAAPGPPSPPGVDVKSPSRSVHPATKPKMTTAQAIQTRPPAMAAILASAAPESEALASRRSPTTHEATNPRTRAKLGP